MPFLIGETIGAYRLVEQLGQGGMATVYKAYHAALDRFVAIKALHPAFMGDSGFLDRFQREARLVARLEHPNIVPIYDFSEHEGRPYLVMKYIEGQTLKAYMDKHPLPMPEILSIAEVVGGALQYAHGQNILHRDIKPSNVILARDGTIYLADFGLARIAQGGASTLTNDMLIGTPQYISPEQAQSKPDLDGRTDIYSFGVMLYEMLTGRVPFTADTPFSIIHDQIYTPLPLPRLVNANIPEAVERVLLKALAKDPGDRFASVAEMLSALRLAIDGMPVTDQPARNAVPTETVTSLPDQVIPPAPVQASEDAPAAPGKPLGSGRKKRSIWPWIIAAAGVVLICLVSLGFLNKVVQQRKTAGTATAQAVMRLEMTSSPGSTGASVPGSDGLSANGLPQTAQDDLEKAVERWKKGDSEQATALTLKAVNQLGDNPAYIAAAINYLVKNDAWVLAAMVGGDYYRKHPGEFSPEQLQRLHEALYQAAGDANSKKFLEDFAANPVFQVAELRYQLYYGGGPAAIQAELDKILSQPLTSRRFPEAKLLEVETFIQSGEFQKARDAQAILLTDKSLPGWVRQLAQDLEAKLK
jgi:serine/threonine protein kinase